MPLLRSQRQPARRRLVSTSIRDLLGQVAKLQLQHQTTRANPAAAEDARLVIGAAGTVLSKLDVWRPDWTSRHRSRQLTDQLHRACAAVHAGNPPPATSRSYMLLAAAADAAGILCGPAITAADDGPSRSPLPISSDMPPPRTH